jgi:hypothetical protein
VGIHARWGRAYNDGMRCFVMLVMCVGCGVSAVEVPSPAPSSAGRDPAAGEPPLAVVRAAGEPPDLEPLTACEALPADAAAIVATRFGLVVSTESGELRRYSGQGCLLELEGARAKVGRLLDADDEGNVYFFPAGAADSTVARLEPTGSSSQVLYAGRGIWSFGVSAQGGAFWSSACGPTGIFVYPSSPLVTALAAPPTLWDQRPSVLTDDRTFWSVGVRTCGPAEALSPACGFALVKTTPEGSRELGTTIVDLGAGFEPARLAKCGSRGGARVCGVVPTGVVVWDAGGAIVRTLRAPRSARVLSVAGNAFGFYLLVEAAGGRGLYFTP